MAITGVTKEKYQRFLEKGGSLSFQIYSSDIDSTGGFEDSLLKSQIESGFELKPTSLREGSVEEVQLLIYGEPWTQFVAHVYKHGGKIIYRKLPNGRYEAQADVPCKS